MPETMVCRMLIFIYHVDTMYRIPYAIYFFPYDIYIYIPCQDPYVYVAFWAPILRGSWRVHAETLYRKHAMRSSENLNFQPSPRLPKTSLRNTKGIRKAPQAV